MAQKDYVKRGRAPQKSKTPPPEPKKLPWLRLVVTISLVFAFAYFLWAISQGPSTFEENQPNQAGNNASESSQQASEDPLPEMPKETYGYPDTLKDGQVEIDRKEQQKSERPYLMQCGSFRQQDRADEMRAQLAMQGIESQVRPSNGKNGLWYRVVLGPYDYKRDAEADRHVAQRIGIGTCQIWFWDL